jgi:Fic family protein
VKRTFGALAAAVEADRDRLSTLAAHPAREREAAELVFEEILASCRLAGVDLSPAQLRGLIERGFAAGDHPLRAYLVAKGYADAALSVAAASRPRPGRPFLRLEEIAELHARATRLQPEVAPGTWRTTTLAPFRGGMVPPPFWLVPREVAALVDRLAQGPPPNVPLIAWVAAAHERFERIHPFSAGNGRVGRLLANLLLRKSGLPPFSVLLRDAERYLAALRRADSRDPWPLATIIGRSVRAGLARLIATATEDAREALVPLIELAPRSQREALYKAAQRGPLQTVRRHGKLYATRAWLAEYRANGSRTGGDGS